MTDNKQPIEPRIGADCMSFDFESDGGYLSTTFATHRGPSVYELSELSVLDNEAYDVLCLSALVHAKQLEADKIVSGIDSMELYDACVRIFGEEAVTLYRRGEYFDRNQPGKQQRTIGALVLELNDITL